MSQTEKILSYILKGGLLLTPFLVFVVTRSLYFPFISGKNFAFRILVEILAAVWIIGALKFPNLRPRLSPVLWAAALFAAIMGLATIFALSPYRSFWSSFERMEGYAGLLHFFLYFLLLISVFKTERDWLTFFYTSIGASLIISFYGVLQLAGKLDIHQGGTRVDATLGNATYLAAYILFHLFFIVWFFLRAKNLWWRVALGAAFALETFILYHTATRGAILGLAGGLAVLGVILALSAEGRVRRFAVFSLGVVIALPVLFFLIKNYSFVRKSPVLSRFSAISLQETTTQSRFTIWKMAIQGWREKPVLGWGQESFIYIFSKYYEPSLWRQEPWFDRAHNIFLDWLTAGGVLGLASYLSVFAVSFLGLLKSFRKKTIGSATFAVFASILAAHFFQNIFVFDNLTSYLLFFAVVAYVHYLSARDPAEVPSSENAAVFSPRAILAGGPSSQGAALPPGVRAAASFAVVAALVFLLYSWNIKPILAAKSILNAIKIQNEHAPSGKVDAVMDAFKKGIALNTFGTIELREQISQLAAFVLRDQSIAGQDKNKYLAFAVQELEAQKESYPSDMRVKAFLATLYSSVGRPADAVRVVNEALEVSARRPHFYFIAGEAYANAGQYDQAISALKQAYELAPDYPEAVNNLITISLLAGQDKEVEDLYEKHFGTRELVSERFADIYARRGALDKALAIRKKLVLQDPANAELRANLGVTYARLGRDSEAVKEVEEAIRLEPRFQAQGEQLIQQIKSGALRQR